MAKRGVFFQLYLNPHNEEDRQIIKWLEGIPRSRRSRKVREILLGMIHGQPQQFREAMLSGPNLKASGMARGFLGSLSKKRNSE